jgi:hypothetical protein
MGKPEEIEQPSIKGMALVSVVEDVVSLLRDGRLSADRLEQDTKPEDRDLLHEMPLPTLWYPIERYARLLELLWDVEGGRNLEYMVDRGARAAERILAAGAYANLVETAEKWGGDHVGRAVINLSRSFYNFTRWDLVGSTRDASFRVEVHDAAEWPDVARIAAQGFLERLFTRGVETPIRVESRREGHDRVVFEITRA